MQVQANENYPEVKVEKKNSFYAELLLNDYAGITGELSAITLYSFQNFSLFDKYPKIAHNLIQIAKVEMKHLELLGKTINLLGVKPCYVFREQEKYPYKYWSSNLVNYDTNIYEILKYNIVSEEKAIFNYQYHLSLINDKYIRKLLERIIIDEKIHIKCFQSMLKEFCSL